jgi:hypothetical protein
MTLKWNAARLACILVTTVLLLPLLTLTGCMTPNSFSQFYNDYTHGGTTNLPTWAGHTSVFSSANLVEDGKDLIRKGYILIGESAFQSTAPTTEQMILIQARKVGADVVLYKATYLGSQQTEMPMIHYNPGQTYTTSSSGVLNANAYGSSGYAYGSGTYFGNSTTTTPGTYSTEMVPMTLNYYSHDAVFFRKNWPPTLGALALPLTEDLKATLQRNSGVVVGAIVNDSPAFRANILQGDVILTIAGEEVATPEDYKDKLKKLAGQKVDIEIWRNGETKTIPVQLNVSQRPQPMTTK